MRGRIPALRSRGGGGKHRDIIRRRATHPGSRARVPSNCGDRKSTRLNSSHRCISYAVFFFENGSGLLDRDLKTFFTDPKAAPQQILTVLYMMSVNFFLNHTATPEIYTLSLNAALPI